MVVRKRVAIIIIVLLITGLAFLVYFLQQGRKHLLTDPYKAITPTACIVIETADFQSFINALTTGKGIFGEAGKVREFDGINKTLKYFSEQLNKAGFKKILNDGTTVLSFHPIKSGRLQPLLSMTLQSDIRLRQIKEILRQTGIKEINESRFNGSNILELPFILNTRKDTAFISIISGLLLTSTSRELLESALFQTGRENDIRSEPGFSRILMASGKNEDKVFVIFANLSKVIEPAFRKDFSLFKDKISNIAGIGGGDIYINEDGLVLTGYTESLDSTEFLYKYKVATPGSFHTFKVLPSSTVLFETLFIPQDLGENSGVSNISAETSALALRLKKFTGEEVTKAYIDIRDRPVNDNTLIIYELRNRVQAEQIFLEKFGVEGRGKNIFFFQPDDQVKIPVYLTHFKGLISLLLPGFATGFDDSYITFYDNYMITGSSYVTISRFLYDNLLNKTLANDLTYRDFESTLPSRAVYFFYCVPSQISEYLSGFLNDDINRAIKSNKNSINKIPALGYKFTPSNGMIYNSLSIMFKEEAREESTTEWETLLDTIASIKPFFFTNHISGAREIFIQDMKNNVYLINIAGRVLWKVPLNERINGSVYMIDYYRNGKYQLLFAGRDNIHLLDRNGNYVERYPVRLRSPATNSLALFDYDNNRNYRLLIAGEDRFIYSYEKTGSIVKGWKPFRTVGIVRSEINYFKVSGKDYIVVSDESSIYFLDRSGNIRLIPKEPVTRAVGSGMRLITGSEPSIVCTSPEGTVQFINFDGSVKKFSLLKLSGNHSFDFFDIDGDGFDEYVFIDKGVLYFYDQNKTEMFTRKFGSDNLGGPINFIFSATDRKVGVFDNNKKLIYLIDKSGETLKGFPLRGASMFSIGKLSEKSGWHLIVGGTDRFLYNYKIETDEK
jgi:hypothetical protein